MGMKAQKKHGINWNCGDMNNNKLKNDLKQIVIFVLFLAFHVNGQGQSDEFKTQKLLAEEGDKYAQLNLGFLYKDGDGIRKNTRKTFYWWKKSAEQGLPSAQANLAWLYEYGVGTQKNLEKAVYWYTKSANNHNAIGQHNLAMCYFYGRGIKINKHMAAYWMRKSYDNGYEGAKESWEKMELWKY